MDSPLEFENEETKRDLRHFKSGSRDYFRRFGGAVAGLGALITFAAVTPGQAGDSLTITNYGISGVSLPWAVAQEKGFIKQNGVEIDGIIGSHGGGTSIRNFMASKLQVGQVAVTAAVGAINNGIPLIFIYSPVNNAGGLSWMVKADSPVKTIKDMKGKKASFSNPRSTTEMMLRLALQRSGMEKDVQIMPSGGISAGLTLLSQGAIDAAPVDEPPLMDSQKYRVLFHVNEYLPHLTWEIGVTTPEYAKAHPETIRGLINAWRQAVKYIYAHPDEAETIYAKAFNTKIENAKKIVPELLESHYYSEGAFNMDGLNTMLDGMKLVGALKKPFDAKQHIDKSFLPKDLQ